MLTTFGSSPAKSIRTPFRNRRQNPSGAAAELQLRAALKRSRACKSLRQRHFGDEHSMTKSRSMYTRLLMIMKPSVRQPLQPGGFQACTRVRGCGSRGRTQAAALNSAQRHPRAGNGPGRWRYVPDAEPGRTKRKGSPRERP